MTDQGDVQFFELRNGLTELKTQFSGLDSRVDLLIKLIVGCLVFFLGAAGSGVFMIFGISKDISALNRVVAGYDSEAFMRLVSAIQNTDPEKPGAKELKAAVERIAQDTYEKSRKGEPVAPSLYYELGTFSFNNGKVEDAIAYFQKAVEGNRLDFRGLSSLGACYLVLAERDQGRTREYADKALEPLKRSIEIDGNHVQTHNNLGIAYYLLGQRDDAIKEWKLAIKVDRHYDGPYYQLACMYAGENDKKEALKWLYEAVVNHEYDDLAGIELDEQRCFRQLRDEPEYQTLKGMIVRRNTTRVIP
jgi:tetratricopeptide (TPR) repeat protein